MQITSIYITSNLDISYFCYVDRESEEWSSQQIFQLKQLEKRCLKKLRAKS